MAFIEYEADMKVEAGRIVLQSRVWGVSHLRALANKLHALKPASFTV